MEFETENQLITKIATQYLEAEEQNLQEQYNALGQYNENRFNDIPMDVEFTENDPYEDSAELFEAIDRGELKIYNGGSSPDGMTEEQNLKGRAVHDYFGHYKNRCDFTMKGEFEKWFNQKEDVPDQCEDLLFSEVVGQTALVHHLEEGFNSDRYEQKSVLLSDELIDATTEFYKS